NIKMNYKSKNTYFLIFFTLFSHTVVLAQERFGPAVERWRSFLSYAYPTSIATDGSVIYCGTNSGFFTYDKTDGSLNPYSKSNGMSDVDISAVTHDLATGKTIIGYSNSNIDIFKNQSFLNLPDLYIS